MSGKSVLPIWHMASHCCLFIWNTQVFSHPLSLSLSNTEWLIALLFSLSLSLSLYPSCCSWCLEQRIVTHTHTNARGGFSLMVKPGLKHRSVNNSVTEQQNRTKTGGRCNRCVHESHVLHVYPALALPGLSFLHIIIMLGILNSFFNQISAGSRKTPGSSSRV